MDAGHEAAEDDVATMVDTNCVALARMTRLVVPAMAARDSGHVVNMSSVGEREEGSEGATTADAGAARPHPPPSRPPSPAAHHAYPGGAIYCACKHWVDAFTASLRADLVATNVQVTAIAPGAVATPEFGVVRFKGDKERAAGVYAGYEPLTGEDCADAVIYAVTRPTGCAVGEVVLWATRQATPTLYGRRGV